MRKLISAIICLFCPLLAYASSSSALSFAPPATDYSVVFLGDIFGVVDGVLHGTGSQIMGQMFAIFNAAVLALGGIVIIYTLLVSTLNTANEGQMLGQKWNSLWVPVRATLGLALLIPKASGYCVMQIFVMWVILQGVGAADKVWNAALSYLNRGGVIVPPQSGVISELTGANSTLAQGASAILSAQTCMLGLQYVLTTSRQGYIESEQKKSGPCAGTPTDDMLKFCNSPVPDFLSTVNAIAYQSSNPTFKNFSIPMPNFDASSDYYFLNGICGTLSWNAVQLSDFKGMGLSKSELQTASMSRAIAIQQLYLDLSAQAQAAVANDSQLNPGATDENTQKTTSAIAVNQFGLPYQNQTMPCVDTCTTQIWGKDPTNNTSIIFNGFEFAQAISDYNAIMQPTLNLMNQSNNKGAYTAIRTFIDKANQQGWIMAGSYFFQLAQVNANAVSNGSTTTSAYSSQLTDQSSGLEASKYTGGNLSDAFTPSCNGDYALLCTWLLTDVKPAENISGLVDGSNILSSPVPAPNFSSSLGVQSGIAASTIYGLINNSSMMQLPGQPGLVAPALKFRIVTPAPNRDFELPKITFDCGSMMGFCIGQRMGNVFYNTIGRVVLSWILGIVLAFINIVLTVILYLPLNGIAMIFEKALDYIQTPNVNPIIGLANMGVYYINFSIDLFILMTILLMPLMAFLGPDLIVIGMVALAMPLLLTFFAIMMGLGFLCAYYIPFVPYLVFTFASIGWLMAVIEAMVAAPIVALGITHPEGEGPFGKGEQALMILMNVFLRPSMMIIGYIAGIILSYVSIWLLNAGFGQVAAFINGTQGDNYMVTGSVGEDASSFSAQGLGYPSWAGMFGFFFSVIMYTFLYMVVVQKSFTLITLLPDKILRWIGGAPESYGQDTSQWTDEVKGKIEKSGEDVSRASAQVGKKAMLGALSGVAKKKAPQDGSAGGGGS